MKTIISHNVTSNGVEGREPTAVSVRFSSESEAKEFIKRKGNYATMYGYERELIRVFESVDEHKSFNPKKLKAAALEKLTEEERILLGLGVD